MASKMKGFKPWTGVETGNAVKSTPKTHQPSFTSVFMNDKARRAKETANQENVSNVVKPLLTETYVQNQTSYKKKMVKQRKQRDNKRRNELAEQERIENVAKLDATLLALDKH